MAKPAEEYFELAEGETMGVRCRPAKFPRLIIYIVTLGLYEFWRRVNFYAVTNRRVAERAGLITRGEASLPLFYVQDAAIQTFLWWGRVNVSTAGGESGDLSTHYLKKDEARSLRSAILEGAHDAREQRAASSL